MILSSMSRAMALALNRLEAAQDGGTLWEATRKVLGLTLPFEFCCLNFYPFLATPPMIFRERPFDSLAHFQRFVELNPCVPHVMANPGIRWVRLTDQVAESELLGSKYDLEFMQPFNGRYEMALLFWDGSFFQGLVGLHRAERHGDFSDTEISLLLRLYEHFQNGLRRVLRIQREKAIRGSLELLFDRLPLATIILDWELRVTYQNRAAEELCVLWNLGPQASKCLNPRKSFVLPEEIFDACRSLKGVLLPENPRIHRLEDDRGFGIDHPVLDGLRARVNLLQTNAAPLSLPMLLIRLENREDLLGKRDNDLADRQLALWVNLSRSEQLVARLAGQGCRNDEIAQRLGKSVLTVKKQLQSVYHKLEVNGRSRLIALLSSSSSSAAKTVQQEGAGIKRYQPKA